MVTIRIWQYKQWLHVLFNALCFVKNMSDYWVVYFLAWCSAELKDTKQIILQTLASLCRPHYLLHLIGEAQSVLRSEPIRQHWGELKGKWVSVAHSVSLEPFANCTKHGYCLYSFFSPLEAHWSVILCKDDGKIVVEAELEISECKDSCF